MSLTGLQKLGFLTNPLYIAGKAGQLMGEKLHEKWEEKTTGQKVFSFFAPGLNLAADTAEIIKEDMAEKTTEQKLISIFGGIPGAVATSVSNNQEVD